ncbi:MAG TPA: hypothetical protein VMR70_04800 [Flavisolibacter sp.]|nr:hypothetical protein [Flavisolibacter sp.]
MNKLLTTIIFIWIVSFGCKQPESKAVIYNREQTSFQQTGLKETIDSLLFKFKQHKHGRNTILIEGKSERFTIDSLARLLVDMKAQDKTNIQSFDVFKSTCNDITTLSWEPRLKDSHSLRFVKHIYHGKYTELDNNIELKITDFELFNHEGKRAFMLRLAEDYEFELLSVGKADFQLNGYEKIINGIVYKPVFEDRLLGLDEILAAYESKKKACR